MSTLTRRRRWALAGLAALALGLAGAGPAQAAAQVAAQAPSAEVAGGVVVQDVLFCDGGAQERVYVRTENTTTPLAENGAWVALPGMSVNFVVPMGDVDHILVIFSAETVVDGQAPTYEEPGDQLMIRILLDGVPMEPLLNDQTFASGISHSNAVQACRRVPAGNHTITVQWWLQDFGAATNVVGQLDGKALHVQQSD